MTDTNLEGYPVLEVSADEYELIERVLPSTTRGLERIGYLTRQGRVSGWFQRVCEVLR